MEAAATRWCCQWVGCALAEAFDRTDGKGLRGLVGGAFDRRLETGWTPRIEHPLFLNPRSSAEDAKALRAFLAEPPVAVEIGFGRGLFLVGLARSCPRWRVVGLEVRRKCVLSALTRLDREGLTNARVLLGDARELLPVYVNPGSLEALFLLFPDPWWKRKHHKRRLLSADLLAGLVGLLRPGGLFLVRSDVPMVLELTREAAAGTGFFREVPGAGFELPVTDRERRYLEREVPYGEACFRRMERAAEAGADGEACFRRMERAAEAGADGEACF
ncbi:MAG: tRNA (guanosine(46)-N7)-methyltransferase TrmB, partial [Deltaproteobacteria bacterium]|nr:tRNA (guanosine(46)-N7)-methyltransferase TrmB [Deltaproteobacteria bacterium]